MMWENTKPRFIHTFGYHLAIKMLGAKQVSDCIRQAYQLQQQDLGGNPFQCFRASWTSSVRFPWQLPKSTASSLVCADDGKIKPETLFVDLTFDFIFFPVEIVVEGRTDSCHVLKIEEFWGDDAQREQRGGDMMGDADSIAVSVAVRIGALVAIPSHQCIDASNSFYTGKNERGRDDGYQYYYQRGDKHALTVSDLDDHCRCIDIVLEEMDAADVARIVGDAFLDGTSGNPGQLVVKENGHVIASGTSSNLTTIDNLGITGLTEKHLNWHIKVDHMSLQAFGFLPLSYRGGGLGEPIGRSTLDMTLLQSNINRCGGACVSVPTMESLVLWKTIDPTIIGALEKPVEPSPQKMSPCRDITAAANPAAQEEEKNTKSEEGTREPKTRTRRPPKPQQTALFTRNRGNRRKKPKFTLGPL